MITEALTYFRDRMGSLGYSEWEERHEVQNIPDSRLDKAWVLEVGQARGISQNPTALEAEVPVTVYIYRSATRSPSKRTLEAMAAADAVVMDVLKSSNRLTQPVLKTVRFDLMTVDRLSESNDNGVTVKLDFTAVVMAVTG